VTAPSREGAFHVLADHGIVAQKLVLDPVQPPPEQDVPPGPGAPGPVTLAGPAAAATPRPAPRPQPAPRPTARPGAPLSPRADGIARALDSALDEAGLPVSFDALSRRYQGKQVWVLDRDKIRVRVMQLVDQVIAAHMRDDQGGADARREIAVLLEKMFADRANIGSQQAAHTQAVEAQVQRLASVVGQMEKTLANMTLAARGDRRREPRRAGEPPPRDDARDAVLLEVFETNLALIRELEGRIMAPAQEKDP